MPTKTATGDIRIGIAGWTFPPWRGHFYPKEVRQKDELAFAARQFRTLEINGTFYSMQKPPVFASWAAETPDDFVFSMKAPRYVTHMRRLKDCAAPIANFLASGILRLGPKLGPILWQLPPNMKFEADRIEEWLALLPHTRGAAAEAAAKHEPRMEGRAWLDPGAAPDAPLRHAVEVRHESFLDPAFVALLRRHGVAVVMTDGVSDYPQFRDVTAEFLYVRLHLSQELPKGQYDDGALDSWADRVRSWAKGAEPAGLTHVAPGAAPKRKTRDVFLYVDAAGDETVKLNTPAQARELIGRIPAATPKP